MESPLFAPLSRRRSRTAAITLSTLSLAILSCATTDVTGLGTDAALNFSVLNRGNILIGFINNTNARAIFTFGGFDQLDETTVPTFGQLRLNAGSASSQIVQPCRRVFAIGSPDLIRIVDARGQNVNDAQALVTGVNFSTAPANDPLATAPTEGTAAPLTLLNGVDYVCDGLLLFSFDEDPTAAGGFKITYRFVQR